MKCPTCYQRIVAPQAPSSTDGNVVFTGHKYVEKKTAAIPTSVVPVPPNAKRPFPLIVGLVVAAVLGVMATAYVIHQRPASQAQTETSPLPPDQAGNRPATTQTKVAPPANDADWHRDLQGVAIPNRPVAGRIHGQDFLIYHCSFDNGRLSLNNESRTVGVAIDFQSARIEALVEKTIAVSADTKQAATVTLRWSRNDPQKTAVFDGGYALRLEFGKVRDKRYLIGKIYLCTPDDTQIYLSGTFKAYIMNKD
jgi:hypothetical protein